MVRSLACRVASSSPFGAVGWEALEFTEPVPCCPLGLPPRPPSTVGARQASSGIAVRFRTAYHGWMNRSRGLHPFPGRRVLKRLGLVGVLGYAALVTTEARADMCLGSGNPDQDAPNPDASDGAVGMNPRRSVGAGLLASASVATVWLSLRRSNGQKRESSR